MFYFVYNIEIFMRVMSCLSAAEPKHHDIELFSLV